MPDAPAAAQTPDEIERLKKEEEKRHIERLFKHTYGHRVRYEEIDAQGVVGSASWLNLIQLARIEYLRHLGLLLEGGRTPVQVMVRRASLEYLASARFDDVVILKTRIAYIGNTSARFEYLADSAERVRYVVAETLVVCVDLANQRSTPWPGVFRERVREFEEDGLQIGQLIR